jgi:hypothetical protein
MTAAQPPSSTAPVAWNRRTLLVAALLALFVVWQLAMPTAALFGSRPQRFGWQMYSTFPQLPKAWTIDAAGVETPVEVKRYFAQLRAEVDFAGALRAGLCAATGAVAVKVADPRGVMETIPCQ